MQKKTLFIVGISSFIGSNLAQRLKNKYRIIGTYFNTPVNIPGILTLRCDVHNKDLIQKLVLLFKPDVCVYAVGLTDLNACQEFPKVADALNTAGVFNVAMASERYHAKFVYFSSCYIFSGENILFKENETPTPSSVYGNTMAAAEFFIQRSCLNYIIFRSCPVMGRSYNPNDLKWVEVIERQEYLGQKISCDTNTYTGFIDIDSLINYFDMAIQKNVTNKLLQISSKDLMNRYEFTRKYLEIFGGNTGLLAKGDWGFPRTENQLALQTVTEELRFEMDLTNAESEFEESMPSIEQVIKKLRQSLTGSLRSTKQAKTGISFI